jgi:hypothetical protein
MCACTFFFIKAIETPQIQEKKVDDICSPDVIDQSLFQKEVDGSLSLQNCNSKSFFASFAEI